MVDEPLLSIVTPTRGDFGSAWFEHLLAVRGNVEFILIYPPGGSPGRHTDERVRTLISPYKGEVFQRALGILNARGRYVLALDDDDLVHPDIAGCLEPYFREHPQSWVLGLVKAFWFPDAPDGVSWPPLPDLREGSPAAERVTGPSSRSDQLREIPIAPLHDRPLDLLLLVCRGRTRKDCKGPHLENFNNKIWRTSVAVRALGDLMFHTRMCGAMRWVPSWNLDRLLGLYVQAMSYEPGRVIGHSFRAGPQYYFGRVFQADRVGRFIWAADALLLKRFPRYSYFWNLLFEQIRGIPGISFAIVKKRLGGRKSA